MDRLGVPPVSDQPTTLTARPHVSILCRPERSGERRVRLPRRDRVSEEPMASLFIDGAPVRGASGAASSVAGHVHENTAPAATGWLGGAS